MTALLNTSLLLLLLCAPSAFAGSGSGDGDPAVFNGLPYPIEATFSGTQKIGAVLLETPYSEPPAAAYDTILVQGLMTDPGARVDFSVKARGLFSRPAQVTQTSFRRYPNGRFWAKYRVELNAQPLKLKIINTGAPEGASVSVYETELLAGEATRETPVAASTVPYVPDPALFVPDAAPFKIVRRAAWGALPPTEPYSTHTPVAFTLHHTQGNYPQTFEAARNEVQFIQDYHQNAKEWIDIGYHFVIDPSGNIFEGRPIGVLGAHVVRRNPGNVGISIIGNYHPPVNNPVTRASLDSFVSVGGYVKDTYSVHVSSFYAHREIGNSDCPGDGLYAKKPEIKDLIFKPQPRARAVKVLPSDAPPMTPAQQKALKLLLGSFD
ncbi:MAG: hypothetical protein A2049_05105 [Elusimicrobia bacterium GWA2_62_23]|nr:MAG: hypothetical protein A2049_05105 [Elusimicrobia bacterium GWA2_62_23]OGR72582.1 MAG: hypothetical protein A2179_02345 [Elusimicrobia bacterium GWC2_63_65]